MFVLHFPSFLHSSLFWWVISLGNTSLSSNDQFFIGETVQFHTKLFGDRLDFVGHSLESACLAGFGYQGSFYGRAPSSQVRCTYDNAFLSFSAIFFWNSFTHWNRKMRMQALRPCWDDIGLKPWICTLCKGRKVSPKCDQMWESKSAKVEYRGIPLCHGLINGDRNLGLGASVASLCHPYLSYIDHVFANNVVYYISLSALSSVTMPW